jgi:hypothetical protein
LYYKNSKKGGSVGVEPTTLAQQLVSSTLFS